MSQPIHDLLRVDTRPLGRQPGAMRTDSRRLPALADLEVGLTRLADGAELELDFRLEAVLDGVLVTGTVRAPVQGECARCLDPVSDTVSAPFQELFRYPDEEEWAPPGEDGVGGGGDRDYYLEGEWIVLEPVVRDALVPAIPDSPLCAADCPGLCIECGARLADVGQEHAHEKAVDPRWANLREFGSPSE